MTTITICRHQGLFFTVELNQVKAASRPRAYEVNLIPHLERCWAAKQSLFAHDLDEAHDLLFVAVKNAMQADREIAINVSEEFEQVRAEWDSNWALEDSTKGQVIRDALAAQLAS